MIKLSHISKDYRISKREPGLKAAVKSFVHKEYEIVSALKDISFEISDGEIVGYIGPNGAGKSSTIKIMSGILTPTDGTCVINGKIPWKNRVEYVKEIGVVFGQRSQLWWDVPVNDSFALLKDIYWVSDADYRKRLSGLEEILDLGELLKIPARQLSLGQRMRCEIGASLLHQPKILFLDEPTIGLDAVSKLAVRSMIRMINREYGTTIILTTHDMQDIESVANRILFIGKGRILMDGTMEELKRRYASQKTIEVWYEGAVPIKDIQWQKGIEIQSQNKNRKTFSVNTNLCSISDALHMLSKESKIKDIQIKEADTEEIVASLYKEYHV